MKKFYILECQHCGSGDKLTVERRVYFTCGTCGEKSTLAELDYHTLEVTEEEWYEKTY